MIIISSNEFLYALLFVNSVCDMNIFGRKDKQKGGQLL